MRQLRSLRLEKSIRQSLSLCVCLLLAFFLSSPAISNWALFGYIGCDNNNRDSRYRHLEHLRNIWERGKSLSDGSCIDTEPNRRMCVNSTHQPYFGFADNLGTSSREYWLVILFPPPPLPLGNIWTLWFTELWAHIFTRLVTKSHIVKVKFLVSDSCRTSFIARND